MRWIALVGVALAVGAAGAARAADDASVRGTVGVNPLSIVTLVSDTQVRRGELFVVAATVSNAGPIRLDDVTVTLVRAPAIRTLPGPTQILGRLPPRSTRVALWLACSNATGGFVLVTRAAAGPTVAESTGQIVHVTSSRRSC